MSQTEPAALILRQAALIEQQAQVIDRQERLIKGLWKQVYMLQRLMLRACKFEWGARETLVAMSCAAICSSKADDA